MGTALITIKIMPVSVEANLKEIQKLAEKIVAKGHGKNSRFEEVPIAFGLKALHVFFDLDEEIALEPIETMLRDIENVNSAEVIDMRRAFG